MYIFISFHFVYKYYMKSAIFSLKNVHVTSVILIVYNCSINNRLT